MNRKRYTFMLSLLPVAFALMACEGQQGPQGPTGSTGSIPAYIEGFIANMLLMPPGLPVEDTLTFVIVTVYNTSTLPGVEINGVSLSVGRTEPSYFYGGFDFPIPPGQTANLMVNYTKLNGVPATAQASVALPGGFVFLDPPPDQLMEIPVGAGFSTTWSAASGADAYDIHLWLQYDYVDTAGNDAHYDCSWDTTLDATSISISPALLFPDPASIASVSTSSGQINILALQGPWQEGDPSNITGDASGAFYAWTGINRPFGISGASSSCADENNPPTSMQQFLMQKTHELAQRLNQEATQ